MSFLPSLPVIITFDVAALECGEVLFGDLLLQRHQTVEPVLHHVARNLFHCGGRACRGVGE